MNHVNSIALAAAAFALVAIGAGAGVWWGGRDAAPATPPAAAAAEREVLYWYDPMVPEQRFDRPGKSPFMDMQLVPRYADEAASAGVRIDPTVQQNLGMRTAKVELGRLGGEVRVPATLQWDLRRESLVSARVDAIVARLHVKAPYERVHRGQPLAGLLAPQWSSAIAELRALERADSAAARSLQPAARQRLRVLGLSDTTVRGDLVVLRAPGNGVVSEVLVREGETVMAGAPLFRVNGTDTLWLEAAIPQGATAGIAPGTPVEATVSAVPGRTFPGEVETVLPQIDPGSRTQRARIVLRNEDGVLVPGMLVELRLQPQDGAARPLVPSEALIATGEASRVFVVDDDGSFVPVAVRTGRSIDGRTEILEGLRGGETVVVSGQFLIDSEASLSGALERLRSVAPAESDATAPEPTPSGQAHPRQSEAPVTRPDAMDAGPDATTDGGQP